MIQITKRVFTTMCYLSQSNERFIIPRCMDCSNYNKLTKKCSKFNTYAFNARANPSKCGLYARHFKL
jgi:hypothetical protein